MRKKGVAVPINTNRRTRSTLISYPNPENTDPASRAVEATAKPSIEVSTILPTSENKEAAELTDINMVETYINTMNFEQSSANSAGHFMGVEATKSAGELAATDNQPQNSSAVLSATTEASHSLINTITMRSISTNLSATHSSSSPEEVSAISGSSSASDPKVIKTSSWSSTTPSTTPSITLSKRQREALRSRQKTDAKRDLINGIRSKIADVINTQLPNANVSMDMVTPRGLAAKKIVLEAKTERAQVLLGNGKGWNASVDVEGIIAAGELVIRMAVEQAASVAPGARLRRKVSKEMVRETTEEEESPELSDEEDDYGVMGDRPMTSSQKKKAWVHEMRSFMADYINKTLPGAEVAADQVTTRGLKVLGIEVTPTTDRAKILQKQQNYWRNNHPIREILTAGEWIPSWIPGFEPNSAGIAAAASNFTENAAMIGSCHNYGEHELTDEASEPIQVTDSNSNHDTPGSDVNSPTPSSSEPEISPRTTTRSHSGSKNHEEYARRVKRANDKRQLLANYINARLPGQNLKHDEILPSVFDQRGIILTATTKRAEIMTGYWKTWRKDTPAASILGNDEIIVTLKGEGEELGKAQGDIEDNEEADEYGSNNNIDQTEDWGNLHEGGVTMTELEAMVVGMKDAVQGGKRKWEELEGKMDGLERMIKKMKRPGRY